LRRTKIGGGGVYAVWQMRKVEGSVAHGQLDDIRSLGRKRGTGGVGVLLRMLYRRRLESFLFVVD
jgi:hypothetical protein